MHGRCWLQTTAVKRWDSVTENLKGETRAAGSNRQPPALLFPHEMK